MNGNEMGINYNAVLADLKRRRDEMDAAIVAVENIIASSPQGTRVLSAENGIPAGAFFTMSIPEATKSYLSMVKRKQPVNSIIEALAQGGLPRSKYSTVYAVLRRRESQIGDIINIDGEWALTEWNPNFPKRRTKAVAAKQQEPSSVPVTNLFQLLDKKPIKLTLGDGAEMILREAGELHIDEIVTRLAALGKTTHKRSLNSTLLQDSKKRFKLLGKNVFTLA